MHDPECLVTKECKIFVQNSKGIEKYDLVHAMNGYGKWNMEPLVILCN
jgi:hypothetical protein